MRDDDLTESASRDCDERDFEYHDRPSSGGLFGGRDPPPHPQADRWIEAQALERTELVSVEFGTSRGLVPRPSLLGAIVAKAVAVDVDDLPDAQRLDLALLLSLVDDPVATDRGAHRQGP